MTAADSGQPSGGLRSMTGYGRGEAVRNAVSAVAELSSVNRRQLDVRLNLPRCLALRETSFQRRIQQRLTRGHVTGAITVKSTSDDNGLPGLMPQTAKRALDGLRETAAALGLEDDLKASHLLQIVAMHRDSSETMCASDAEGAALEALERALTALCAMRATEGQRLFAELAGRLQLLRQTLDAIETRAPAVIAAQREQVKRRLADAGESAALEDDALRRELLLMATRADITEEITRLHSHFEQAEAMMQASEPTGRALDFLVQEFGREINTLGAKAGDALIARDVVIFKTELDRFREQVQNIE